MKLTTSIYRLGPEQSPEEIAVTFRHDEGGQPLMVRLPGCNIDVPALVIERVAAALAHQRMGLGDTRTCCPDHGLYEWKTGCPCRQDVAR